MSGEVGLWMFPAVAALMVLTGLPAWTLLVAVSLVFAAGGIAAGKVEPALLTALPSRILGLLESDILQALPLYVLMGVLLNRLPLAEALYATGRRALRRTGAGLPLAGLGLGVLLSPMNGSVGASVAMLSHTVLPRLDAQPSADAKNAALICVASTMGVVVPPSLVLILLGDAMLRAHTEAVNVTHAAVRIINTHDVFRGALVPAAIFVALSAGVTWLVNRRGGGDAVRPAPGQWLTALVTAAIILGLMGGVALGYLYAVEAAAAGGVLLFAFGLATRSINRRMLAKTLHHTLATTGALFALLLAATVFTLVLRAYETDRWIAGFLAGLKGGPPAALAVVIAMLLACALVLDAFEMIFAVIPLLLPPLLMQVPDAVWVAVITLLILQASFILPPFGYAVIMLGGRLPRPVGNRALLRAMAPYVAVQIVVVAAVIAFPALLLRAPDAAVDAAAPAPLNDAQIRELIDQQSNRDATAK